MTSIEETVATAIHRTSGCRVETDRCVREGICAREARAVTAALVDLGLYMTTDDPAEPEPLMSVDFTDPSPFEVRAEALAAAARIAAAAVEPHMPNEVFERAVNWTIAAATRFEAYLRDGAGDGRD